MKEKKNLRNSIRFHNVIHHPGQSKGVASTEGGSVGHCNTTLCPIVPHYEAWDSPKNTSGSPCLLGITRKPCLSLFTKDHCKGALEYASRILWNVKEKRGGWSEGMSLTPRPPTHLSLTFPEVNEMELRCTEAFSETSLIFCIRDRY